MFGNGPHQSRQQQWRNNNNSQHSSASGFSGRVSRFPGSHHRGGHSSYQSNNYGNNNAHQQSHVVHMVAFVLTDIKDNIKH